MSCNKLRYDTRDAALIGLSVVRGLNMAQNRDKRNQGLHVYECPYCRKWHVGHQQLANLRPTKPKRNRYEDKKRRKKNV